MKWCPASTTASWDLPFGIWELVLCTLEQEQITPVKSFLVCPLQRTYCLWPGLDRIDSLRKVRQKVILGPKTGVNELISASHDSPLALHTRCGGLAV
jgi:hypothetical protein